MDPETRRAIETLKEQLEIVGISVGILQDVVLRLSERLTNLEERREGD